MRRIIAKPLHNSKSQIKVRLILLVKIFFVKKTMLATSFFLIFAVKGFCILTKNVVATKAFCFKYLMPTKISCFLQLFKILEQNCICM